MCSCEFFSLLVQRVLPPTSDTSHWTVHISTAKLRQPITAQQVPHAPINCSLNSQSAPLSEFLLQSCMSGNVGHSPLLGLLGSGICSVLLLPKHDVKMSRRCLYSIAWHGVFISYGLQTLWHVCVVDQSHIPSTQSNQHPWQTKLST